MKKIKVADATGPALDWLVAHALGLTAGRFYGIGGYSSDWSQGGPIIDQMLHEGLILRGDPTGPPEVAVVASLPYPNRFHFGPTALVAAMRCFVASRLGDEVEVPEEF